MFQEIKFDESFLIPEARTNQNLQFNYFPNYEPQEIFLIIIPIKNVLCVFMFFFNCLIMNLKCY